MPSKPKPSKADRPKRRKASKPRSKILKAQLEAICKQIVFWRDGAECVEKNIDGVRCGGGIQWGHFIPRSQSAWLIYEIGNTFAQCRDHNGLHKHGAQTMAIWFCDYFGAEVAKALEAERDAHRKQDRNVVELEELLAHYDELYQNRYYVTPERDALIRAGYFGEVIKRAWEKKESEKHEPIGLADTTETEASPYRVPSVAHNGRAELVDAEAV